MNNKKCTRFAEVLRKEEVTVFIVVVALNVEK